MGIWLSWSTFDLYRKCGKAYHLKKVKKQEPPFPESKHNAVIGTVVQRVFEDFYNKELWRRKDKTLEELLRLTEVYHTEVHNKDFIDYNSVSCRFSGPSETLKECYDMVPKVLQGIKNHKLLGPYARSEINIKARYGMGDFLHGYLDFVIRRADGKVLIIDGKASKHREKYVDKDQLHFYALLFYLRYKKLPNQLGIFYYHFADDPELAFDWVDVDKAKIAELKDEIDNVLLDIRARRWGANPVPSHCKFCIYESVCEERLKQKQINRAKRAMSAKTPDVDIEVDKKTGSSFIGFDTPKKK